MATNPYQPPATQEGLELAAEPGGTELAGRFTRFAAALVDGVLMMAVLLPVQLATGFLNRAATQDIRWPEQLAISLLGWVIFLVFHGYLLTTRGQSVGKLLTKIQIVDVKTEELLPFVRVFVYRYLWILPLSILTVFVPGSVDDVLVNVVLLIDVLLIFGQDRRCLHDYIAGSKVVIYQEGRPRTA